MIAYVVPGAALRIKPVKTLANLNFLSLARMSTKVTLIRVVLIWFINGRGIYKQLLKCITK